MSTRESIEHDIELFQTFRTGLVSHYHSADEAWKALWEEHNQLTGVHGGIGYDDDDARIRKLDAEIAQAYGEKYAYRTVVGIIDSKLAALGHDWIKADMAVAFHEAVVAVPFDVNDTSHQVVASQGQPDQGVMPPDHPEREL